MTAKFRASRRLRFKDTKIIMSPELRPKSFGTFEKRAPGPADRSMVRANHCLRRKNYAVELDLFIKELF